MANQPLLIGLTGSIGAGKSTVADIIAEQYPVLNADRIARDIMEQNDAVRSALLEEFGVQTYISDGSLDRSYIAEIVFDDPQKLEILNSIVHPPTIERIMERAASLHVEEPRPVFVESALVFEAGTQDLYDYVIAVISPVDKAVERIMQRDGLSENAVRRRMRSQLPPEEKAKRADFTIRNNGTLEDLRRSTAGVLSIVTRLGGRRNP